MTWNTDEERRRYRRMRYTDGKNQTMNNSSTTSIDGLTNFRDLGSLPLRRGGVTRSRRLLRSESLATLSAEGRHALERIPVRGVLDLRTDAESGLGHDPDIPGARMEKVPILAGQTERMIRSALASGSAIQPAGILQAMYINMVDDEGGNIAQAVRVVAATLMQPDGAELVHCTAGKDRTGILIAMMLDVAGVERDAIIDDYAASHDRLAGAWSTGMREAIRQMGLELDGPLQELLILSPADVIIDVFAHIEQAYCSIPSYLTAHGVTTDELEAIRTGLAH